MQSAYIRVLPWGAYIHNSQMAFEMSAKYR